MSRQKKHPPKKGPKRICNQKGCEEEALYKAPLSPQDIRAYQYFCLPHIQSFNKEWNYYKDWTEAQIERDHHGTPYWHRPSWPMGDREGRLRAKLDAFFEIDQAFSEPIQENKGGDSLPNFMLTYHEIDAFQCLGLKPTKSMEAIKLHYKKLVKKFHPDQNPDDSEALEMMKKINQSYVTLKALLKKCIRV